MKVLGQLWERRYVDTLTFWVCNSSFKQSPPGYEPYQLGLSEHVGEKNMVEKKQLHESKWTYPIYSNIKGSLIFGLGWSLGSFSDLGSFCYSSSCRFPGDPVGYAVGPWGMPWRIHGIFGQENFRTFATWAELVSTTWMKAGASWPGFIFAKKHTF